MEDFTLGEMRDHLQLYDGEMHAWFLFTSLNPFFFWRVRTVGTSILVSRLSGQHSSHLLKDNNIHYVRSRVFLKLSWGCRITHRKNIFSWPTNTMRSPANGRSTPGSCFSSKKRRCAAWDWQLSRRRQPIESGRYTRRIRFKTASS